MSTNRNLAARIGRWSARHRRTAIFGWLAFVVAAFVLGGMVGTRTLDYAESGVGESGHADATAYHAFPQKAEEGVLIESSTVTADSPEFRAVVKDVMARLSGTAGVQDLASPYDGDGSAMSANRHAALVQYAVPGDQAAAQEAVDAPIATIAAAAAAHPDFRIDGFGDASSSKQFESVIKNDLHRAEIFSLPLTLAILLAAFGGLLVAGVPLLLALSAVAATLGLVGPISQISAVSDSISSVVLLIGLAVGVDYALFYVRRVREERAAGREGTAAIEAAAATSGRAVLISGFTVAIAMAGMYLGGAADFTSFATATIVVVLLAMIGSVTVLPALLAAMGGRVDRRRGRIARRIPWRMPRPDVWGRVITRVMRRPLAAAVVATAVLVALALPALQMKTAPTSIDALPQDLPVVQTYTHVMHTFPSQNAEAAIVVEAGDVTAPSVTRAIAALTARAAADPANFPGGIETSVNADRSVARISVPTAGDGSDAASDRALDALRGEIVPSTLGRVAGVTASVTGEAATTRDFNDSMRAHLPYVLGFVLVTAFALLLVTFRSIVVPIKAIVLNLLSVGAAYGVLVTVFQHKWAEGLLGFSSTGAIVPWLPLFLFVILFGLSMDYHVFVLSRVREAYDGGASTREAVDHGIRSTAGVVTSAAVIMVAVFAIFAGLSLPDYKQMGVGLAAAVLLDATLIRGVLLPASMVLLGERNWWLPRSLGWLPQLETEREVAPAHA